MAKVLRPYQADAVEGIFREWQMHRSVMLVLATGTGKTATASEVVSRRLSAGKVLWLAHRTELIEQARDALQEALGDGVRIGIERPSHGRACRACTGRMTGSSWPAFRRCVTSVLRGSTRPTLLRW